jgi:effector-binding domain-containing protein
VDIQPALKEREPVAYAGFRLRLHRDQLAQAVPEALASLRAYFAQNDLTASAPAIVRYLVVDYNDGEVEIDVGLPVTIPSIPADARIHLGQLPRGTYASVLHRGSYDTLVDTTAALLDWAKETGAHWHVAAENNVTWWAARVEHYLVAPPEQPQPDEWLTEVAILLRT